MDESDEKHSEAFASKTLVQGKERRLCVQAVNAYGADEDCPDEGHRVEVYQGIWLWMFVLRHYL